MAALPVLFTACGQRSEKTEVWTDQKVEFVFDKNHNTLQLINHSDEPVRFSFSINDRFPLTDSLILRNVSAIAKHEKIHETEAAWMYVTNSTYHSLSYSTETWQNVPSLFINSIGGGLCYDRASVLAAIWGMFGYEACVTGLTGHVIPEVFHNGTWQMFDPDERVYFCDTSGTVMSINDIANKISSPVQLQERICNNHFFCEATVDTSSAARYLRFITSTADNADATEWHVNSQVHVHNTYQIPSNCSLHFISNDGIHVSKIILKLSETSHGTIDLPFVVTYISGAVQTRGNTVSGNIPQEKLLLPLDIDSCTAGTEITFLVNGKLKVFNRETNFLSVSSSMPMQDLMGFEKKDHSFYQESSLFFDTITQFHRASLTPLPVFRSGPELVKDLSAQYAIFNRLAPTEGRDTVASIQVLCDSLLLEFGPAFEELLLANQPKSIHYLFLAHTYGEKRHLKALVNGKR
ncbi:MAG: hypothetical protein KBF73_09860 [Flavobacteriales bacterium]|nr:hypothetical protein [Flavobacteriales bacterium]